MLVAELLLPAADEHKHQVHKPSFTVPENGFLMQSASATTELEVLGEAVKAPFGVKVKRNSMARLGGIPLGHSSQLATT